MENGNKSQRRNSFKASLLEELSEKSSEIRRAVEILFETSAVVELRAFRGREIISGYFNNHPARTRDADRYNELGHAAAWIVRSV